MKDIIAYENGKYGNAVLGNSSTKILMGMDKNDAEAVKSMLNLTENNRETINNLDVGEGLLVRGGDVVPIKFVASKTEHNLITTDGAELARISAQNKLIQKYQSLPNYKDVFVGNEEFEIKEKELVDVEEVFEEKKLKNAKVVFLTNEQFKKIERAV